MAKEIRIKVGVKSNVIPVKVGIGQTVERIVAPEIYAGPVVVTPTDESQTLQTKDKMLRDNIVIGQNRITLDGMADHSEPVVHDPVINADNIVQYAFSDCTGITGVVQLPNAVRLGAYAFSGCAGITEIRAPKVETIAGYTFSLGSTDHDVHIYLDSLKVLPSNSVNTRARLALHMPVVEGFPSMCFAGAYGYLRVSGGFVLVPASVKTVGSDITRNTSTTCIGYKFYGKPDSIDSNMVGLSKGSVLDIYVPWSEGEVSGAPWGGINATVHYNTVYDENGDVVSST